VALDAAEIAVDVLDGGPDPARPAGADEHLPALRVDRADHDRRQLRVRPHALGADVRAVVRDRAGFAAARRERDGDGERQPDDGGEDRDPDECFLSRPHARSSLLPFLAAR
jgi:hypothetical protein